MPTSSSDKTSAQAHNPKITGSTGTIAALKLEGESVRSPIHPTKSAIEPVMENNLLKRITQNPDIQPDHD